MKLLLPIILIFIMNSFTFSQNFTLPLWSGEIPNNRTTNETEKRDTQDIVRISNVQVPDIAVFLPSKSNATGQAVVVCPGGGYAILAYDWEGTDIAKWLNSKGIAAIVVKYRLPGSKNNIVPYLSPLLDAQRALRLTRYHAQEWNIDTSKVGIMGFSAGGHLASTAGTHFDYGKTDDADSVNHLSCRPDFMILMYPVITFTESTMHKGSKNNLLGENPDPKLVNYYSNELQVKTDTPPTFLVHAGDDTVVPVENSLLFYKALRDKNITAELHIYPTGGHGFSLAINKNDYLQTWTDRCVDWLRALK